MEPLTRWLIPLAAVALVLVGLGLYRWFGGPARTPAESPSDLIAGNGQPTLVAFGMDTCASCKAMQKVLDELRAAHAGRLRVVTVNVMQEREATAQWPVRAIPTQVLLDGEGREVYRHLGYLSAPAIRERFAAHGMPLGAAAARP
jgi:thioredoxin 1